MPAKVGRPTVSNGVIHQLRSDTDGCLMVSGGGARLAEWTAQGRVFAAANQAAVSTSAALTTTWTGLGIFNPSTSDVDLVMLEFGAGQAAAGAASAVGIMVAAVGANYASVAASAPVNQLVGSGVATHAVVDNACTPGTPVLWRVFGFVGSVATTGYAAVPGIVAKLDGSLIIPPGYAALTYTTTATTTAFLFHFLWAEIDR